MSSGPAGREEGGGEGGGRKRRAVSEGVRRTAWWVDCEMRECIRKNTRTSWMLLVSVYAADFCESQHIKCFVEVFKIQHLL